MKNKCKWMVVILCVCTLITSCSSEMKPVDENLKIDTDFYVYVDPKTGVNYIVYEGYKQGGITVRYNSDGSIMVTEKDGEVDVSR